MMSWFRKSEPDYDHILAAISTKITARERSIHTIKLRERRANVLLITYGVGIWVIWAFLWWFGLVLPLQVDHELPIWDWKRVIGTLVAVGGPLILATGKHLVRVWYTRQERSEDQHLAKLRKEQREKIEELKRKTGYYSTQNILEKYDEVVKKKAEQSLFGSPAANRLQPPSAQNTPARQVQSVPNSMIYSTPQTSISRPNSPVKSSPLNPHNFDTPDRPKLDLDSYFGPISGNPMVAPSPPVPVYQVPKRTVFDKVADALLGVIPTDETSPMQRYALICSKCFAHNGLAVKEEFDSIQYQCPRCGFFNSRRPLPSPSDPHGSAPNRRRVQSMVQHNVASAAIADIRPIPLSSIPPTPSNITPPAEESKPTTVETTNPEITIQDSEMDDIQPDGVRR